MNEKNLITDDVVEAIMAVVHCKYEVANLEICIRGLHDGSFYVSFHPIGRDSDEESWEEVFDTCKEATLYFLNKCKERYG